MLATTPSSYSSQAFSKSSQNSASSTRASSPASLSSSSDDTSPRVAHRARLTPTGALARRRGRKMLVLSELVLAAGVADTQHQPLATGSLLNQTAQSSLTSTSPVKKSGDASQRIPAHVSRLGAAAAGGDASQRCPTSQTGRISLGVAVIGGDASQRSPPGCTTRRTDCGYAGAYLAPMATQSNGLPRSATDTGIQACSGSTAGITCTQPLVSSPTSSCSSTSGDASQRTPTRSSPSNTSNDVSQESLKSWLSGARMSDMDLAEQLRAAAPETYED